MVRRSLEQWIALFKEFEQSKSRASEFCRERNLCPRYFSKRKKPLGFDMQEQPVSKNLVKIKHTKPVDTLTKAISLQHAQTKITIPSSQSPEWVASLIKELAQ